MWQTFSVADALPSSVVYDILQDMKGNFWFGTLESGVSRYDGIHFSTFTTEDGLADNLVSRILEDRGGNLWFATLAGVSPSP